MGNLKIRKLPSIRRLPTYLYKLKEMDRDGVGIVATPELARCMNLAEIVIRKDLALTGVSGQPGVGYRVPELIDAIVRYLKWDSPAEAVLMGVGSLGKALLGYSGFADIGLQIVAAFDSDPSKIGESVHGRTVMASAAVGPWLKMHPVPLGIICVPAAGAQEAADQLVAGGVRGIWNFANVSLVTPDDVIVQREVIAGGLAELSVKLGVLNGGGMPLE